MDLSAKTIQNGFYYEFEVSPCDKQDMHILRVNQKTQEMKDYIWPLGANLLYSKVIDQEWRIEPYLTTKEVVGMYVAEWCLDDIHEWVEVDENYFEDYGKV